LEFNLRIQKWNLVKTKLSLSCLKNKKSKIIKTFSKTLSTMEQTNDEFVNKKAKKMTFNIFCGIGLISFALMIFTFMLLFIIMFLSFSYIKVDPKIENYKFNIRLIDNQIKCNPQFGVKYIYDDKEIHSTVEIINPPKISFNYNSSQNYQQLYDKCSQLVSANPQHKISEKLNDDAYIKYGTEHHFIELLINKHSNERKGLIQSVMIYINNITTMYIIYFVSIVLMLILIQFIGGFGFKILKKQLDILTNLENSPINEQP
jgi:hypothetical protein